MKIQFLQKNDLFDKDFKSYAIFVGVICKKRVYYFCSSIANHEDFSQSRWLPLPSFLFSLKRDGKKYRKRYQVRNNFYQTINWFGSTFCNQLLISKTVENSEKYGRHQIEVQDALKKFGCLGGFPGALERLRFKFTLNGKREFVPRDQVFAFIAVNYLLLQLKNK